LDEQEATKFPTSCLRLGVTILCTTYYKRHCVERCKKFYVGFFFSLIFESFYKNTFIFSQRQTLQKELEESELWLSREKEESTYRRDLRKRIEQEKDENIKRVKKGKYCYDFG